MRLFLDPWPPDFESPLQIDDSLYEGPVDVTVETERWEPIRGAQPRLFGTLHFIDGGRRIDARVMAEKDGKAVHGLFGTYAVGSVTVEDSRATISRVIVGRLLILGNGISETARLAIGPTEIEFQGIATPKSSPEEALAKLQYVMRDSEARLGQELLAEDSCVFADGPLTYFSHCTSPLVGIVKKMQRPYLDPLHFGLLYRLQPCERTPLFLIPDPKHERYSWYLRLAQMRAIDHPLAGLIRLEIRSDNGIETAQRLADFSAFELPRFASTAARDPRAPQNLLPIGALESELRRRMGDPVLIRRAIERSLSQ